VPIYLVGFATISHRFPTKRTIIKRPRLSSVSKSTSGGLKLSVISNNALSWDGPAQDSPAARPKRAGPLARTKSEHAPSPSQIRSIVIESVLTCGHRCHGSAIKSGTCKSTLLSSRRFLGGLSVSALGERRPREKGVRRIIPPFVAVSRRNRLTDQRKFCYPSWICSRQELPQEWAGKWCFGRSLSRAWQQC
jgi:hypothetical protein